MDTLTVEYCGESTSVTSDRRLVVGREGDVRIDDNPFLHRHFLVLDAERGMWFISNVGAQLAATVSDADGRLEAFLAPGASLPLVFRRTKVAFTAGPTSYEFTVLAPEAAYFAPAMTGDVEGDTTVRNTMLTADQRLLIVALAESRLRGDARNVATFPSSTEAAARLGWTTSKFNRKLDNVCDKLARLGVRGLRGDQSVYASNRRSRVVEYAIATRLVTPADLQFLDTTERI